MNITTKILETGFAVQYQMISSPGTANKRSVSLSVADNWLEIGEATELSKHNWAAVSTRFKFDVRGVRLFDVITLLVDEHNRRTSWQPEHYDDGEWCPICGTDDNPIRYPRLDEAGSYLEKAYPNLCKLAKLGDAPQVRVRNVIGAATRPCDWRAKFKGGYPIIRMDEL